MTSVEDVIGSFSSDLNALQQIQAQIEDARAYAEELRAQLQDTGVNAEANAVGAGEETLIGCGTMTAALANKVGEGLSAAESAR